MRTSLPPQRTAVELLASKTRPGSPTWQIVVDVIDCGEQWIIRRLFCKLKKTLQISIERNPDRLIAALATRAKFNNSNAR